MFSLDLLQADSFSWRTAYGLALCSHLAYQPKDAVGHIAHQSWGFRACDILESAGTQLFLAHASDLTVVSFRGTENCAAWLANLKTSCTESSYGTVHQGIWNAFESAKSELRAVLTARGDLSDRRVLLTGHGVGGALATIAFADFVQFLPEAMLYTFGQPCVGKGDFAEFSRQNLDGRIFRVVNDDDIVPRVPPTYKQVGQLLHLGEDGNFLTRRELPPLTMDKFHELQREILRVQETVRSKETVEATAEALIPSLSDSRMSRYISKIRRLAFETPQVDGTVAMAPHFRAQHEVVRGAVRGQHTDAGTPLLIRLRGSAWTPPAGLKDRKSVV